MRTVTLSIDDVRHRKLKETGHITGLSMSEVVRIALDKLWRELGDLKSLNQEVIADLQVNKGSPEESRR